MKLMQKKALRPIVGLDMDGVIIDNTPSKIKFARQLGFHLKPEETTADQIEKILPAEVLGKLRKLLYQNPETALLAPTVRGAKSGLNKLQKFNCRYFLISRRKDPEVARALLKKRGLWPNYFNDANAFFVAQAEDKNKKAVELGIDLYLDDQPSVLDKLTAVPQKFLMDQFGIFEVKPHYRKVATWPEFLSYLIHNS